VFGCVLFAADEHGSDEFIPSPGKAQHSATLEMMQIASESDQQTVITTKASCHISH